MIPRTELTEADVIRQLVRLAYGDLTPFMDEHGYVTSLDLPPAAAAQIAEITAITTAAGTRRIKVRAHGAASKRQSLKLVERLAHHSDPAIRQLVREERQRISAAGAVA